MPLGERRRSSLLVLGAGLVLAGGLAACTNGEGAEPDPTETLSSIGPTAAPSAEPTADGPEVEKPVPPEAMARDDVAGAEAAAQYFLELYPYVHATGDLTEWDAMSAPGCQFCKSVRDGVLAMHSSGESQIDGGFEITFVGSRPPGIGVSNFAVWVDAIELPSALYDTQGNVIESFEGGPLEFDISLLRGNEEWSIEGVDHRDQPNGA